MIIRNQRGFMAIEGLIILVVVAAIGFGGWKVYDNHKKDKNSSINTSTVQATKLVEYQNTEWGFKFQYPEYWGSVIAEQGKPVTGMASYTHLFFTQMPKLDINAVTGAFSFYFDGACGFTTDLVEASMFTTDRVRSSVVGWSGESVKRYLSNVNGVASGKSSVELVKMNNKDGYGNGWTKITSSDKVFVFQEDNQDPYKDFDLEEYNTRCGPNTSADVKKATGYYKFTYYADNYKNNKVVGVNALFDGREGSNTKVQSQLVDALNSFKDL